MAMTEDDLTPEQLDEAISIAKAQQALAEDKKKKPKVQNVSAPAAVPGIAGAAKKRPMIEDDLSEEELDTMIAQAKGPGIGSKILDGVVAVGGAIDSVTGAPVRASIGALQDGKGLLEAGKTFGKQFAEDPSLAPTGKAIALKAGVSDKAIFGDPNEPIDKALEEAGFTVQEPEFKALSPADLAGLGIDVAADPTNLIPVVGAAKTAAKGAWTGVKTGAGLGAKAVEETAAAAAKGAARAFPRATSATKSAADSVKNAAKYLAKSVKPEIRPQYAKDVELALRNGIDPELLSASHKYGEQSFIANARKAQALDVAGEPLLKKQAAGMAAVRDAVDADIAKIGHGQVLDPISAGETLKGAYKKKVTEFFDSMDMTYDRITDKDVASGLMVNKKARAKIDSKLSGMEKWAKGRASRGFTATHREQGKQVLNAIEAARAGNGSFKQMKETLRDIGEIAYGTQHVPGDIPPDIKKFRELYETIREGLIDTVDLDVSPDFAKELVENNKAMTEFFRKNEQIVDVLTDPKAPGEKIFRDIIQSGNSQKIRALKEIVDDPATLGQMKAAFLEEMKVLNPEGAFTFERLANTLENNPAAARVAKELFEPGELDNFKALVKLGADFGPNMNPSGTARTLKFMDLKDSALRGAVNSGVIDMMERGAAKGITGNPMASATEIAQAAKALPAKQAVPVSRSIGEILDQMRPEMKSFSGVGPQAHTKLDFAGKALRLVSSQSQETVEEIEVPVQLRPAARKKILDAAHLSNTQKAKALDRLNRRGKVDLALLRGIMPGAPAPEVRQPAAEPIAPPAPKLESVTDFFKQKRPEPY